MCYLAVLLQGKQMMDGLKNMLQVLDYALLFIYYHYYVMRLLWFIYRHYMKHSSFFCEHCVSMTKNRFNGFILIDLFHCNG
ncbi:unnamed protein product [Brassica rapa]|uniref:Uncharacterized protein n=1 Tax=Brassica campestris TaxID=3711 RepID=A0A8D9M7D0_BRACM|nr:unnamed protein product [Brassica rapa]